MDLMTSFHFVTDAGEDAGGERARHGRQRVRRAATTTPDRAAALSARRGRQRVRRAATTTPDRAAALSARRGREREQRAAITTPDRAASLSARRGRRRVQRAATTTPDRAAALLERRERDRDRQAAMTSPDRAACRMEHSQGERDRQEALSTPVRADRRGQNLFAIGLPGRSRIHQIHEGRRRISRDEQFRRQRGIDDRVTMELRTRPTLQQLANFERNPIVALHALYESRGFERCEGDVPQGLSADHGYTLANALEDHVVSLQRKRELTAQFKHALDPGARLLACASCGVRHFTDVNAPVTFSEHEVHDLGLLRYTSEQQEARARLSVESRLVISAFDALDGTSFHLHPELVVAPPLIEPPYGGDAAPQLLGTVQLCDRCSTSIGSMTLPGFSIAAGVDYGLLTRTLGMEVSLSRFEEVLVARKRVYITLLKLSYGQSANVGHSIAFAHDGPDVAAGLDWDNLAAMGLDVTLLCPPQLTSLLKAAALATPNMIVDPDRVYKVLRVFKEINPLYSAMDINDTQERRELLGSLPSLVLERAHVLSDDVSRLVDLLAASDVARVREDGMDGGEASTDRAAEAAQCIMAERHLTPLEVDMRHAELPPPARTIINDVLLMPSAGLGTTLAQAELNAIGSIHAAVRHLSDDPGPSNEFTANGALVMGAFPSLFPTGIGLSAPGSISQKQVMHMLHQFHGAHASHAQFIFYIFNQLRRHKTAQVVAARVRTDPGAFQGFSDLLADRAFMESLDSSVARSKAGAPETEEDAIIRRFVLRRALPLVRICGSHAAFSAPQRAQSLSQLVSITQTEGSPCMFLTIAPDDIHNLRSIRVSIGSSNNVDFPANDDGFLEAIRANATSFRNIDLTYLGLNTLLAKNPVAAAECFIEIMDAVFTILLGLPTDMDSRRTQMYQNRPVGIFGRTVAFYNVVEMQGRGSLHAHMAIWCSLAPETIQKVAADPRLSTIVARVLESQISCEVPGWVHTHGEIEHINRARRVPPGYTPAPDPVDTPLLAKQHLWHVVNAVQIHKHTGTCRKGVTGKSSCRLCMPRGLVESTYPVQLKAVKIGLNADGKVIHKLLPPEAPPEEAALPIPLCYIDPVPRPDPRVITVEVRRPTVLHATRVQALLELSDGLQCEWRSGLMDERLRANLLADMLKELSASQANDVLEYLDNHSTDEITALFMSIEERNGRVVEFNDVLSSVLACNTCAASLGSVEQAKAILFYLLKYITKDSTPVANSYVVIRNALLHVRLHPSVAENTGEGVRTAQHIVTRSINSLTGASEISLAAAAYVLLGGESSESSEGYWYAYVRPAMKSCSEANFALHGVIDAWTGDDAYDTLARENSILTSDMDGISADNEFDTLVPELDLADPIEEIAVDGGDRTRANRFEDADSGVGGGSAQVYATADGGRMPVAQHDHYKWRGHLLNDMNLHEYVSCVVIVKKEVTQDDDHESRHATVAASSTAGAVREERRGRPANAIFEFDDSHPLHLTHVQRLRSKLLSPILAGPRAPPHPGRRPQHPEPTTKWRRKALDYASYMLVLLKPWGRIDALTPGPLTWTAFVDFVILLADSDTFISRSRMTTLRNISHGLCVDTTSKWMQIQYRARNADKWEGQRVPGSRAEGEPDENSDDQIGHNDALVVEAQNVMSELRNRINGPNLDLQLRDNAFIDNTCAALDTMIGATVNSPEGEGIFVPTEGARDVLRHHPALEAIRVTSGEEQRISKEFLKSLSLLQPATPVTAITSTAHASIATDAPPYDFGPTGDFAIEQVTGNGSIVVVAYNNTAWSDQPLMNALNVGQRDVANELMAYISASVAHKNAPQQIVAPVQLLRFVHGGPGTGKTTLTKAVHEAAMSLGTKGLVTAAFCGVAAINLPEGQTLHGLLSIPVYGAGAESSRGGGGGLREVKERLADRHVLLIDEISMVSSTLLVQVDQKLRAVLEEPSKPFGGMSVVIMGDMHQLPPTGGVSLYKALLRLHELDDGERDGRGRGTDTEQAGGSLFSKFVLRDLTQQMRAANDPSHTSMVNQLRDASVQFPFTRQHLDSIQELSTADMISNPAWRFAPILVTNNALRDAINEKKARWFAKLNNQPVIMWCNSTTLIQQSSAPVRQSASAGQQARSELRERGSVLSGADMVNAFTKNIGLRSSFVAGADGYLTENLNARMGLTNGTLVKFHSLSFQTQVLADAVQIQIDNARPGEVVMLASPPVSVNVTVPGIPVHRWPSEGTIVPGEIVIPLFTSKRTVITQLSEPIAGCTRSSTKSATVDLGFAITYHKAQGLTKNLVVVDLNNGLQPYLNLESLFVGLSRVREGQHMRRLPAQPGGNFDHLLRLEMPTALRNWMSGFDRVTGVWSPDRTREAIVERRARDPQVVTSTGGRGRGRGTRGGGRGDGPGRGRGRGAGRTDRASRSSIDRPEPSTSRDITAGSEQHRNNSQVYAPACPPLNVPQAMILYAPVWEGFEAWVKRQRQCAGPLAPVQQSWIFVPMMKLAMGHQLPANQQWPQWPTGFECVVNAMRLTFLSYEEEIREYFYANRLRGWPAWPVPIDMSYFEQPVQEYFMDLMCRDHMHWVTGFTEYLVHVHQWIESGFPPNQLNYRAISERMLI